MKKKKIKRTKWTPKRFYLLIALILSPLWGFIFWPLVFIGPFWVAWHWKLKWKDDSYGYTRDGKIDWGFW